MNYYIKGDAAKAEQIRATFEAKGFNTLGINFENKTLLYFSFEGCIKHCSDDWFFTHLIKTHPDYQELKLPVVPKFKVGDKVIYGGKERTITFMDDKFYDFDGGCAGCRIELQDELLSPAPKKHYDIANFKVGMPVLVRDANDKEWRYVLYSHNTERYGPMRFNAGATIWNQCIPFEGNEHLLGTTDMPSDEFINW